jgi:hypothetical protein
MEHFYDGIQGWFGFAPAYDAIVKALPDTPSVFVELGLWQGRSSAYLGVLIVNSGKPISYVGVDRFKWPTSGGETDVEGVFRRNLKPVMMQLGERFRVIASDSAEAATGFEDESVDAVWIDADHETGPVLRDIDAWWPKLVRNGLMGGDDWAFPTVEKAVKERFNGWAHTADDGPAFHWPWWWVRKSQTGKPTPV